MNHEYQIEATVIIGKATAMVTAPSPEEALQRAHNLTLGAWKIDPGQKLTVHPTTTLEKLVKETAARFIGTLARDLGEMKDLMVGLHPDVEKNVLEMIENVGGAELLKKILGIEDEN